MRNLVPNQTLFIFDFHEDPFYFQWAWWIGVPHLSMLSNLDKKFQRPHGKILRCPHRIIVKHMRLIEEGATVAIHHHLGLIQWNLDRAKHCLRYHALGSRPSWGLGVWPQYSALNSVKKLICLSFRALLAQLARVLPSLFHYWPLFINYFYDLLNLNNLFWL